MEEKKICIDIMKLHWNKQSHYQCKLFYINSQKETLIFIFWLKIYFLPDIFGLGIEKFIAITAWTKKQLRNIGFFFFHFSLDYHGFLASNPLIDAFLMRWLYSIMKQPSGCFFESWAAVFVYSLIQECGDVLFVCLVCLEIRGNSQPF